MDNFISKIKPYFPAVVFGLILISPLIPTGLPLKKYTRLNEIILIILLIATLISHVVTNKRFYLTKMEILILATGISLIVSNFYGHFFLDVPLGWIDFYQVFNILLFVCYFRLGTFFDYGKIRNSVLIMLAFFILCLNLLSLSQLFPWGYHNILPLYMPKGMIKSMGYEEVFLFQGTIGRIVGTLSSPTSFSIIMAIVILLLAGWVLYIPIKKTINKISLNLLLMLSVFVLLMTYSRSGLAAFLISLFFFLCVARFIDKKNIYRVGLSLILAYLLFLLPQALSVKKIAGIPAGSLRGYRTEYIFTAQAEGSYKIVKEIPATTGGKIPATTEERISDLTNRFVLWKTGLKKVMISPLLGWGIGNTAALEAKRLGLAETTRGFYGSHNEYIELAMQTGLIGLSLLIAFHVLVFRKAARIARANPDGFPLYIARCVQAIIISLAVFSGGDGFWNNNLIPPMLMLIFGSMYAVDKTVYSRE